MHIKKIIYNKFIPAAVGQIAQRATGIKEYFLVERLTLNIGSGHRHDVGGTGCVDGFRCTATCNHKYRCGQGGYPIGCFLHDDSKKPGRPISAGQVNVICIDKSIFPFSYDGVCRTVENGGFRAACGIGEVSAGAVGWRQCLDGCLCLGIAVD